MYLAVQIRQNSKIIRATSVQDLTENINRAAVALLEPENAELYLRGGRSYAALTPEEKFRFGLLISVMVNRTDNLLEFQKLGFVRDSYLRTRLEAMRQIFGNPGVREYWEKLGRVTHTPELCDWVDENVVAQQDEEADRR